MRLEDEKVKQALEEEEIIMFEILANEIFKMELTGQLPNSRIDMVSSPIGEHDISSNNPLLTNESDGVQLNMQGERHAYYASILA